MARTFVVWTGKHRDVDSATAAMQDRAWIPGQREEDQAFPPYRGVWRKDDHTWHVFSDYPDDHHIRFGWRKEI